MDLISKIDKNPDLTIKNSSLYKFMLTVHLPYFKVKTSPTLALKEKIELLKYVIFNM